MSSSKDFLFTRLHQAAREGNTSAIDELLCEDPLLLQRIGTGSPIENPLHIASLVGHVEFAAALLKKQPDLARMQDDQGFFPLHLAAAKGHLQVVKMMLQDQADLCKLRDKEGRTPLHSAAVNGQIDVLKELLSHVDEATARAPTERGETTLHLCVKYNQFEAAKFLVEQDKSLVNMKDADGNTVLHLATAQKQIQLLKHFLGVEGVDAEAKHEHVLTALDVLVHNPSERRDIEMVENPGNAGCDRATKVSNKSDSSTDPKINNEQWAKQVNKNYLIAATLIATVTFAAGFSPPGSVWTEPPSEAPTPSAEDYEPGRAIFSNKRSYEIFFVGNTIAFLASCIAVLFIMTGMALGSKLITWFVSVTMWIAIGAMVLAFCYGTSLVSQEKTFAMLIALYISLFFAVLFISYYWYKSTQEQRKKDNKSRRTAADIERGPNI